MAVSSTGGTGSVGGARIVRPMYGVVIRDQVAQYRNMLNVTLKDLKAGIKAGKPEKHAVPRDGKLQGSEVTKAKKAAVAVDRAIKALKPVFGNPWGAPNITAGGNALNRPGGGFVALYGVVLADDLSKYRTGIRRDVSAMQAAITNGSLKGDAAKEAAKAIKSLNTALKALGTVTW